MGCLREEMGCFDVAVHLLLPCSVPVGLTSSNRDTTRIGSPPLADPILKISLRVFQLGGEQHLSREGRLM